MARGLAVVFVVAVAAFAGAQVWAERAADDWRAERLEVARENAERAGSAAGPRDDPEEPVVAAHRWPVAIGAALVVAVVGSILVLLVVIASGQRRP